MAEGVLHPTSNLHTLGMLFRHVDLQAVSRLHLALRSDAYLLYCAGIMVTLDIHSQPCHQADSSRLLISQVLSEDWKLFEPASFLGMISAKISDQNPHLPAGSVRWGEPSVRESKLVDFSAWSSEVLKPAIQSQVDQTLIFCGQSRDSNVVVRVSLWRVYFYQNFWREKTPSVILIIFTYALIDIFQQTPGSDELHFHGPILLLRGELLSLSILMSPYSESRIVSVSFGWVTN